MNYHEHCHTPSIDTEPGQKSKLCTAKRVFATSYCFFLAEPRGGGGQVACVGTRHRWALLWLRLQATALEPMGFLLTASRTTAGLGESIAMLQFLGIRLQKCAFLIVHLARRRGIVASVGRRHRLWLTEVGNHCQLGIHVPTGFMEALLTF